MRVVITGSTGYLGSRTVGRLASSGGVDIFGIDRNPPRRAHEYAVFRTGSVTDPDAMERIFDAAQPDVAVHLAFVVNPLHDRKREEYIDREGMRLFLHECDRHRVRRVVVLSSVAAYGAFPDNDVPLTEGSRIRGVYGYAYSWMKAETDLMAQDYERSHPDCEVIILRPALFVGPGTRNAFFDVLKYPIVPQVREGGKTMDPPMQCIHEDDMAACLVEAIVKPGIRGMYNVAGEGTVRFSALVGEFGKRCIPLPLWLIRAAARLMWFVRIGKVPAGQVDFIRHTWIMDTTKMKRELSTPTIDSLEAFRQFASARKENRLHIN